MVNRKTMSELKKQKTMVLGYKALKQALEERGLPSFKESLLQAYKNSGKIPAHNVTSRTILFDVDAVEKALLH